ncbi:MAG: CPBP family intramembrane metalloprotease [Candidatus Heimdallarchaeota archaeon]|nr:CPBP family intramembrane metalloprotease [Candidatus Heimdallarchaeota archaeon]
MSESTIRFPLIKGLVIVLSYMIFIVISYILSGHPPGDDGPEFFLFANLVMGLLFMFIIPKLFGLPKSREPIKVYLDRIRLSRIQPFSRNIVIGILCGMIYLLSIFTFSLLTGNFVLNFSLILPPTSWSLLTALVAGIWEEVAFRGVILSILLLNFDEVKAIILSAVFFSFPHIINIFVVGTSFEAFLSVIAQICFAFCAGLFLAYLVIKTNSLLPSIVVHYLINGIGPLLHNAPNTDPIIASIFMLLGTGIVPSILCYIVIRSYFTRLSKIDRS